MDAFQYQRIVDRFRDLRILVIGDLMLDEFIWGKVSRISPEAPVQVVNVTAESYYPGGAANVARNIREFTAHVSIIGSAGTDGYGTRLVQLLGQSGIETSGVVQDGSACTTVKSRIIARHQQVVRVDRERLQPLGAEVYTRVAASLEQAVERADAVVISDYDKGFLTQELADRISDLVGAHGKLLTIDPHPHNPLRWRGATAIKPNRAEAYLAAGMRASDPVDSPLQDEGLMKVGRTLLESWGAECVLVTLGEQGMMLFQKQRAPHHTPTRAQAVFDVSGAGDTAIAVFTLGLAAGASPAEAAELANHASGIVVGKLGTATATKQELLAGFTQA